MQVFRYTWLALLLAAAAPGLAAGQEITVADRSAIQARVAEFDALIRDARYDDILKFMSPRLITTIVDSSGVTTEQLRTALAGQMAEVAKTVKIIGFKMDLARAEAGVTPDRKRAYLLIPTETVMELPDKQRLKATSNTLALSENGVWYLIRIESAQQIVLLRRTYPEFTGVAFPSGSMAAID